MTTDEVVENECSVWWATAQDHPALARLLDDAERRRLGRLRRTSDRDRYVTGHALLRILVSQRTGLAPEVLRFDTTCPRCDGDHGKPRLAGGVTDVPVAFNVAHAGTRVVVAVTSGTQVGVDVELVRDLDVEQLDMLGAQILSTAEHVKLLRLPSSARGRALAVWWTRKEAVLKATGDGLSIPPAHVIVTDPASPPAVIIWHPQTASAQYAGSPSCLRDLNPGGQYVASLAVLGVARLGVTENDADPLLASFSHGSADYWQEGCGR